jgi:hypothetical protein
MMQEEKAQEDAKETKSESSEGSDNFRYIQNEEQNSNNTLWKRIKDSGK